LKQDEVGSTDLLHPRLDLQDVVDVSWFEELEGHPPHDEGRRLAPVRTADQGAVIVAEQAQEVGAPALAPAQIARVIDKTREVRVLEIDANR
jgi:hypothetical protein